jgi:hypothetical protein
MNRSPKLGSSCRTRIISAFSIRITSFDHGPGRCQAERLSDQASLPEELARAQDRGYRIFALSGRDHELDAARPEVENGVRRALLREDHVVFAVCGDAPATACGRKKRLWIKSGLGHDTPVPRGHHNLT